MRVFYAGNNIAGDDDIAIRVCIDMDMPGCEFIDIGMIGVGLIEHVNDGETILIVDAFEGPSGEVRLIEVSELEDMQSVSVHDIDLSKTIKLMNMLKSGIDVKIIGIGIDPQKREVDEEAVKSGVKGVIEDVLRNTRQGD